VALFPPIEESPEAVRAMLEPLRNDLSVAIYNHQNPFSVGAIIRVAHSFLVREIFIIGQEPYYEKASMGMHRFECIRVMPDVDSFLDAIKGRPLWSVEKDDATRSLYAKGSYPRDIVFAFGSERAGLPPSLIEKSNEVLGIPMFGVNHSFPVSVASGMVLCDWARRRYEAGTIA